MSRDRLDDLPLFARTSDPDTSHESMAKLDREAMKGAAQFVVALYRERGPMADFELKPLWERRWTAPCCDHLYQQARSSARDMGLIVDTGERRVNPTTNRRQIVWASTTGPKPIVERCHACGHVLRRKTQLDLESKGGES